MVEISYLISPVSRTPILGSYFPQNRKLGFHQYLTEEPSIQFEIWYDSQLQQSGGAINQSIYSLAGGKLGRSWYGPIVVFKSEGQRYTNVTQYDLTKLQNALKSTS